MLDVLIPKREQKILAMLLLHPEQAFPLSELLRAGGNSRAAGQLIVQKFIDGGICTEERVGNQRQIKLNPAWPLLPDFMSICAKTFGIADPIKGALEPFNAKINQAFLFGSVVKGSDHYQSDIDLMVIGNVGMDDLFNAMAQVEQQIKRPIHFNLYSASEWEKMAQDNVVKSIIDGPTWMIHDKDSIAPKPRQLAEQNPPSGTQGIADQ